MNTKKHLFDQVQEDRKLGLSLGEISKKYNLSKSTVSLWCKDMKLSQEIKIRIQENWLRNTVSARAKGTLTNKQKRIDRIKHEYVKAKEIIGEISQRDLLIIGASLYWAEGSKKETGSGFSFINSDPIMIKLIYRWLIQVMGIRKVDLIVNVVINISHINREYEILKFWSNLLDYKSDDFGNTTFIRTKYLRTYSNYPDYFGMLHIKVRSSAWLRRRILGMIKVINEKMPV